MIQEKSGFWDSIDATPGNSGDERTYNAGEMTIPFEYLVTDGVQTGGTFLQVSPGSYDYSSQIAPGLAWSKGKWYLLRDDGTGGATQKILLHDAPIQYNRIDRIVLRHDANYTLAARKITAAILKGEEAADPVAPELTRSEEIHELSLARRLIRAGDPVGLPEDFTDERFDSELCGIAEFAPQPELQPVVDAFLAQLEAYFSGIQGEFEDLIALLEAGGLPANLLVTTPPEGQPGWANGQAYLAGLKGMADEAAGDIASLKAANAPLTTGGSATAYTLTPVPAVSAYADGQIWTARFHTASGVNPTFNVSGKGAAPLLNATGKAAKVEAGQIVRVMRYGESFFVVGNGGGVSLPDAPSAGDTCLYVKAYPVINPNGTTPTSPGSGWGIICKKAGTYRIRYAGNTVSATETLKLTKNGVDVSGSSLSIASNATSEKQIDVSLNVNDQLRVLMSGGTNVWITYFIVSILESDLQDEINKLIVAL